MEKEMSLEQAQAIVEANKNKKGRKSQEVKEAQAILGITPTKTTTTQKKDNRVYANEKVSDNEKWRYIRIAQVRDLLSSNISSNAYLLLLSLFTSPYSNSLGIFKMSINDMIHQTAGDLTRNDIIKAINELSILGEIRYHNGYIYINNFLSNQKTHGNKDNIIGVIKKYNELPTENKLPYINSINYTGMTMDQLIDQFEKLKKGIEMMGIVSSGKPVVISEFEDIYNIEELTEIITNRKHSLIDTLTTLIAAPVVIELPVDSPIEKPQQVSPVGKQEEFEQLPINNFDENNEMQINYSSIDSTEINNSNTNEIEHDIEINYYLTSNNKEIEIDEEQEYENTLSEDEYTDYLAAGGYSAYLMSKQENNNPQESNALPTEEEVISTDNTTQLTEEEKEFLKKHNKYNYVEPGDNEVEIAAHERWMELKNKENGMEVIEEKPEIVKPQEIPKIVYSFLDKNEIDKPQQEEIKPVEEKDKPKQDEFSPIVDNIFEEKKVTISQAIAWYAYAYKMTYDELLADYNEGGQFKRLVRSQVRELINGNGSDYKTHLFHFCQRFKIEIPDRPTPEISKEEAYRLNSLN